MLRSIGLKGAKYSEGVHTFAGLPWGSLNRTDQRIRDGSRFKLSHDVMGQSVLMQQLASGGKLSHYVMGQVKLYAP